MKYVKESLGEFNRPIYGHLFEKEDPKVAKDKKLKDEEQKDGMAVIKKLQDNFKRFKTAAGNKILKYKEFWEENKSISSDFDEKGEIYKLWDTNYVAGVLNLPDEALSDEALDSEIDLLDRENKDKEPEKEEKEDDKKEEKEEKEEKEDLKESWVRPKGERFLLEKKEKGEDLGLDMDLPFGEDEKDPKEEKSGKEKKMSGPSFEKKLKGGEESDEGFGDGEELGFGDESEEEELGVGDDLSFASEGESAENFVLYDISGSERDIVFRTKDPKVIESFRDFFENTFKAAIKEQIRIFKEAQAQKEAEEKAKADEELRKKRKGKFDKFIKESHWDKYTEHLKTKYPNWKWKDEEEDLETEEENEIDNNRN